MGTGSVLMGAGKVQVLVLVVLQVARSLGILDEVNRMKVLPGASSSSSLTNKNVRYMEVNTDWFWFWFWSEPSSVRFTLFQSVS